MIIRPRHRSNWSMSLTKLLLAIGFSLFVYSPMTAQAESPPTVQAKSFWLNAHQLKTLFQGGIEFSLKSRQKTLTYSFHDDGGWSVKTGSGNAATGHWEIKRNTICRQETGRTGTWSGLNRKFVCFGILKKASRLFFGFNKVLLTLQDPNVLARLQSHPVKPKARQGDLATRANTTAKNDLEEKKRELELERVALELQKTKEMKQLSSMRLELERAKLNQKMRALSFDNATTIPVAPKRVVPDIEFGAYHAIVIGINDYKFLPKLNTALTDARAVAHTLKDQYGFAVHLLENPTRVEIIDKFDELRETLDVEDNLLIYYAGHGWLDKQSGRGYWLPVNARPDRRSRWLSNTVLTDALKALFAKHVMIVADSCFSGTLTRSIKVPDRSPSYFQRIAEKRARVVLASGGLEPVADSGGGEHSVFAAQFLKALRGNVNVLDGTQLFEQVRKNVVLAADQTPEYSDIRKAGHEGGDFLFVRKN